MRSQRSLPHVIAVLSVCLSLVFTCICLSGCGSSGHEKPTVKNGTSLDDALAKRRSTRSFESEPLTSKQESQLLWAAQGVTEPSRGLRTAPSAGALYPLEIYILKRAVLYHYIPGTRSQEAVSGGIEGTELAGAALGQQFISEAPAVFVVTAVFERTRAKYGSRGDRYVYMEAGHAAQNLLLEATTLGLGAVPVGAFDDGAVSRVLKLPADHAPLYLIPVGYSKEE